MVSGGHRRSSQRCAWTPPAVAASDRSEGVRRFCGQPPACMLARPRVLRQRPQGSGWSGRQPLAVPAGAGSPGPGVAFVDRPDGVRASDGRDKCVLWSTSVPGRQRRVQPGAAWSPPATPGYRPAALRGEPGRRTLWAVPPLSATEEALPLLLVDRSLATRLSTPPPYFQRTLASDRTGHGQICEVEVRRESELGGDRWRTWVVAGFATGVDEQVPGLASIGEVRYGYPEMERSCSVSAVQSGGLLISKPYPCRLVLCGLSDTLGLLDCVMLT